LRVAPLLCAAALAGGLGAAPPAARAAWSPPEPLKGCAAALDAGAGSPPLIVYPGSSPAARSGPGVLLWNGPAGCARAAGTAGRVSGGSGATAFAAPLGPSGLPGPGRALARGADRLAALATATGTTAGQVLALGAQAGDGSGAFVEGRAPGSFSAPRPLGGPARPVAAFSGYLGDAVIASIARGAHGRWALTLGVQRHYASRVRLLRALAVGARPTALTVTADYRADLLVVWAAAGVLYAREISNTGKAGPVSRLAVAPTGAGGAAWRPEVRALISDDGRAIVVWRSQAAVAAPRPMTTGTAAPRATAPGATTTRAATMRASTTTVEASISGRGLSFGAPTVVERYRDLRGLEPPAGSLRLTRMSSEAVMLAWTGLRGGRYAVRASPVSLRRGIWAPVTVSTQGSDEALLAELVPGPRAEVLALWSAAPRLPDGTLDGGRRAILAAWGHYGGHGEAVFASPETLAPPGPNGTPAAAFDPADDRALAAWAQSAGGSRIVYAQRSAGPPAQAAPARAALGSAAGSPPQSGRRAAARAGPSAEAVPPPALGHVSVVSHAAVAHGAGKRGALLTALGLLLLVLAAAAAYRGIGRRRGWLGARRGPLRR